MAHHGNGEMPKGIREAFEQLFPPDKFGPTGRFPQGKLSKDDEVEIRLGVTSSAGKVIVSFGKAISWIGMDPDQARELGEAIIAHAKRAAERAELEGK